ncbi:LysM peptidoglycan-binding domain-containing protein [Candidatus Saccharibacteria bacterium]|nr:LysM peptidoglycan-binding domain-containing protein [Candidatus Saccharibacteria bacterium]
MQSKFGLVALSVMATLVLFGGDTAEAKSEATTNKTPEPVIVTVRPGDNLSDIATAQNTTYMRVFNANEAITNPDLIFTDQQLRIPAVEEQLPDRLTQFTAEQQAQILAAASAQQSTAPATAQAPVNSTQASSTAYRGSSAGNTYGYGWCTWYVKNMRPDLPNNLGNGGSWVANAAAQGFSTGTMASAGAVAEIPGHVAYVESVSGGMMTISEMGWNYQQGQFNRRTVPTSGWRFIY